MSNQKITSQEEYFKQQALEFLTDLIDIFPNESILYSYQIIMQQLKPVDLINIFTKQVLPGKEYIRQRDDAFFDQSASQAHILNNIKNNVISVEDKHIIWDWLDTFVKFLENYTTTTNTTTDTTTHTVTPTATE
jgi:hypothetical protein